MNTNPPVLNEEDEETIYMIVSECFGSLKADRAMYEFTHHE